MTIRRLARAARYLPGDIGLAGWRFWRARHFGGTTELTVRPSVLGNAPITLRAGTSDPQVLWYVLRERDQLPPPGHLPRSILDLGANIGVASALCATLFPDARILAVEPDPANARLARRNLAPWSDRCVVVEGAAWTSAGTLSLGGDAADARTVRAGGGDVVAMPIDDLVNQASLDGLVDYVKMNVEGGERELLRAAAWTSRVRSMRVEVHPPYTPDDCRRDLERAGFVATTTASPWVTAVRP